MSKRKTAVTLILIYSTFIIYGISTGIIGTLLTEVLEVFGLDIARGGLFTFVENLGGLIGVLFSGILLCNLKKWNLILIFLGGLGVTMSCMFNVSYLPLFIALMFLSGIAKKMLDVVGNAALSEMFPEGQARFILLLHASFGTGNFLGPVIAGRLQAAGVAWNHIHGIVGFAALVIFVILIFFVRFGNPPQAGKDAKRKMNLAPILSKGNVWLLMIIVFLFCGHQIGLSNWMPTFLKTDLGASAAAASLGVSLYWLGVIAGRIVNSFLTEKFKVRNLLWIEMAAAVILYAAGLISGTVVLCIAGGICAGIFAGAVLPFCITLCYEECKGNEGTASMLIYVALCGGQVLFPWLMGLVAEGVSLTAAMIFNVILLACAAVIGIVVSRRIAAE